MKYNKKIFCIIILLIIVCIIAIIVNVIMKKENESIEKDINSNVEEQKNLESHNYTENKAHNTDTSYKTFDERIKNNEDIMGLLKKIEEDYIEISSNPNGLYGYKDFQDAILRVSKQTKYQNLVTGEITDYNGLNNAKLIIVNDIGKNYFYNYTLNNYEINRTNGNIFFITNNDLIKFQKQTFDEHFNKEEQKISDLKIDLVYKASNRYDSSDEKMDCILYMNIKNKKIPYHIIIYKNNNTVIENHGANNYADIIIERCGENSTKEELLAKKIIYK